jgi:NAD-dependent deacetylase
MHPTTPRTGAARIAGLIANARAIAVMTGAGVSAGSGVPTFRGAQHGLWARYDPMELATPEAFARDPVLVTRWYDQRRQAALACEPNPGHLALARLQRWCRDTGRWFQLFTQNVDRLHQRAGSEDVVELHGTLHRWRCTRCGAEQDEDGPAFPSYPPQCACGGPLRPAVVWFGETLPTAALTAAAQAAERCDLFLSLGTSAVVEPAASFLRLAAAGGAATVEINLESTPASQIVDVSARGRTGELLPGVVDRVLDAGGGDGSIPD